MISLQLTNHIGTYYTYLFRFKLKTNNCYDCIKNKIVYYVTPMYLDVFSIFNSSICSLNK